MQPIVRQCIACGHRPERWTPFRISQASEVLTRLDCIGSNLSRFGCPACGCSDRDRHLLLYLDATKIYEHLRGADVLHMAPERILEHFIRGLSPRSYRKGDLTPSGPQIEKINLESTGLKSGSLDFVIANHVLEHVSDVSAALNECYRILRTGGRFICQTPYAAGLASTFEDKLIVRDDDRVFFYGQEDHVRLFGRDIFEMIRDHGFDGSAIPHDECLPGLDPETYGVNEKEPFFSFVKVGRLRRLVGAVF